MTQALPASPRPMNRKARRRAARGTKRNANTRESPRRALDLDPGNAEAHKALALSLQSLGRHAEAREHFARLADLKPDDGEALMLLAISHRELGQIEEGATVLSRALTLAPDDQETRARLALFLCDLGGFEEALVLSMEAIAKAPQLSITHAAFAAAIRHSAPVAYDEAFEKALCTAFDHDFCRHIELGRPAIDTLSRKYNERAAAREKAREARGETRPGPRQFQLDGIMTDGLLLRLLDRAKVADSFFETFLTGVRRAVLQATPNLPTVAAEVRRFVASLARHCHENSYAYFAADNELAAVDVLKGSLAREIDRLPDSLPVVEIRLALVALYHPLATLPEAQGLGSRPLESWSEEMRPLVKAALHNPLEERAIRGTIPSLTEIEDAVSKEVRAQYESNPYPRWWHSPAPLSVPFVRSLKLEIPPFEPPAFLSEALNILVAGCGTGQHPISIARQTANCKILAVDLSRSSLAYAIRMAREIGVENIDFRHGDILSLSCLDRRFPIIECSGVLHHMREPEAGLATLVDLLRPQGVMKLGLYSELARASIVRGRERIAELGLSSDAGDIRAFRRRILQGEETDERLLPLLDSGDFYDLDGARDLLFHVQEHRYRIPELKDMLQRHGLRFLGFTFPENAAKRAYGERFPQDPDMTDLSRWRTFEEENPDVFRGMYQFWCQKIA